MSLHYRYNAVQYTVKLVDWGNFLFPLKSVWMNTKWACFLFSCSSPQVFEQKRDCPLSNCQTVKQTGHENEVTLGMLSLNWCTTKFSELTLKEMYDDWKREFCSKRVKLAFLWVSVSSFWIDSSFRLQSHNYEERYRTVEGELRKLVAMRGKSLAY